MILKTKVKCPYCGNIKDLHVPGSEGQELVSCSKVERGCGKYFVVSWETNVISTVYRLVNDSERNIG